MGEREREGKRQKKIGEERRVDGGREISLRNQHITLHFNGMPQQIRNVGNLD